MNSQSFYLLGESPAAARVVRFSDSASLDDVKDTIASHFAIVIASGKLSPTYMFNRVI